MTELIVVVVIVGVLATGAMISGQSQMNAQQKRSARSLLRMIYAAERTYRFEQGAYHACSPCAASNWSTLGLDNITASRDVRLRFDVTLAGGGSDFDAKATYTVITTNHMTIDETGTLDESNWN